MPRIWLRHTPDKRQPFLPMQFQYPMNPVSQPQNTSTASPSPWIIYPRSNPQASSQAQDTPKIRLFCFPYAGGGASAFRSWATELPSTIELACIQLPGRGTRMRETPIANLPELIQQLKPAILPHLNVPFAFFGHSMGALIAFELARSLRHTQSPLPLHLFASACRAPQLPRHNPPRHTLSTPELIAELHRLKGTPTEILNNDELMELLLPIIKADFSLVDAYVYQNQPLLSLPITALGGQEDPEVRPEQLLPWQNQTTSDFSSHIFPGDHFFIQQARYVRRTGKPTSVLHLLWTTLLSSNL